MISDVLMIALMPFYFFVIFTFHEFGHYVLARLFRVKIDGVCVGMGKVVWRGVFDQGVSWQVRRFPLSGRVVLNQASFDALSFFKKVMVIMAGPVFNLVLAFILMFPIYALIGQPSQPPVFTAVKVGSVADEAGLRVDDRVLKVNGVPVERYEQVSEISKVVPVSEMLLTIERGGETFDLAITPFDDRYIDIKGVERREGMIGVFAKHAPIDLESVFSVNGVEVSGVDHARALVMEKFGYP
ncbi:MAG: site-2 protease family protein, partial [Bdellovibrionales bacterium]